MDPWRKESLGLQVGDWIIWQGETIEVVLPQPELVLMTVHNGAYLCFPSFLFSIVVFPFDYAEPFSAVLFCLYLYFPYRPYSFLRD